MPAPNGSLPFSAESPATNGFAITPNDGTVFTTGTRGLWVGATGDISVVLLNDSAPVTLSNVLGGTLLPLCVKTVRATGTTATGIVGLY